MLNLILIQQILHVIIVYIRQWYQVLFSLMLNNGRYQIVNLPGVSDVYKREAYCIAVHAITVVYMIGECAYQLIGCLRVCLAQFINLDVYKRQA